MATQWMHGSMVAKMRQSPDGGNNSEEQTLLRFDVVERIAHWLNVLLFAVLILTALPLYFGQVEALVGRRVLVGEIHLWCGILLPVPLLISLMGPWGKDFRADLRRFNRWTPGEIAWIRSLGQSQLELGKFNPGQKLNAIFIGASMLVMFLTGLVLHWFGLFPLDWRIGATFVHDLFAAALSVVVLGHIYFALSHPASMKSMLDGRVTRTWASVHAKRWLAEQADE